MNDDRDQKWKNDLDNHVFHRGPRFGGVICHCLGTPKKKNFENLIDAGPGFGFVFRQKILDFRELIYNL